jgi:hypothetical protein
MILVMVCPAKEEVEEWAGSENARKQRVARAETSNFMKNV